MRVVRLVCVFTVLAGCGSGEGEADVADVTEDAQADGSGGEGDAGDAGDGGQDTEGPDADDAGGSDSNETGGDSDADDADDSGDTDDNDTDSDLDTPDGGNADTDVEVDADDSGDDGGDDTGAIEDTAGDAVTDDGPTDACAVNACGGCEALAGDPGTPCGEEPESGLPTGALRCVGPDAVACVTAATNPCGGAGLLEATPGEPCGLCVAGRVVCDGLEATACAEPTVATNACGGCGVLEAEPGDACDLCGGTWTCDASGGLVCDGRVNLCGGCAALAGVPGEVCGDTARWVCDGSDAVVCEPGAVGACSSDVPEPVAVGSSCGPCEDGVVRCSGAFSVCTGATALNACGGCGPLPGTVGGLCAPGWSWTCEGTAMECVASLRPAGALCADDGECADGWCTALGSEGGPAFCGGLCDFGPDVVDLCPPGLLCYSLNPTAPDTACLAECLGLPDPAACLMACTPPPSPRCLPDGLCIDADADGEGLAMLCGRDCDDTDPAIRPGAPEVCDGVDNDCDFAVDEPDDLAAGCSPDEVCEAGRCVLPEACGNRVDDNGDGRADCADPACAFALECLSDPGVCVNALDLGLLYRNTGLEVIDICVERCGGEAAACLEACLVEQGVATPGCAACVGEAFACQSTTCVEVCAGDPEACIACQQGCASALLVCGGLDAYPMCESPGQACVEAAQSTSGVVCDPVLRQCLDVCDPTVPGWRCSGPRSCQPTPARIDPAPETGGVCLPGNCRSTTDAALCGADQTCVLSEDGAASFCTQAGGAGAGEPCDGVGTGCAAGLLCLDGACVAVCEAGSRCAGGTACIAVFDGNELNRPGICGVGCPGGDVDCGPGGVCQLRGAPGTTAVGVCAPDPAALPGPGQACDRAQGCGAGLTCDRLSEEPVCVSVCDPVAGAGCAVPEVCATTDVVGLGQCSAGCDPLAVETGCGPGQECVQLAPADGRYDPRYAVCVGDRGRPGVGGSCDPAIGCAGSAVCVADGTGSTVCAAGCDVLGDGSECDPAEVCAFVITPAPYVLGACRVPANAGASGDPCTEAGPCSEDGTTCSGAGPGQSCLQVCGGSDDCPAGQACVVGAIDWEGRPIDIGLCL